MMWEGYTEWLRQLFGNERFATLAGNDTGDHVAKNIRRHVIACKTRKRTMGKSAGKSELKKNELVQYLESEFKLPSQRPPICSAPTVTVSKSTPETTRLDDCRSDSCSVSFDLAHELAISEARISRLEENVADKSAKVRNLGKKVRRKDRMLEEMEGEVSFAKDALREERGVLHEGRREIAIATEEREISYTKYMKI